MSEKLLTVVIPVYNTEKYLRKCLDSIIVSEFIDKLEILVIIDGSPDNSIDIAREYEAKYPDTFIVVDKENGGHGSCCNIGLMLAKGKYIKFLDSDDWFDKNGFPDLLTNLERIDVDIIQTNHVDELVYKNERIIENAYKTVSNKIWDIETFDFKPFRHFITLANTTFKTNSLRNSGIKFRENSMFDDTALYIQPLISIKKIYCMNISVYHYFIGRVEQSTYKFTDNSIMHKRRELVSMYHFFYQNYFSFVENVREHAIDRVSALIDGHFYECLTLENRITRRKYCDEWYDYVSNLKYLNFSLMKIYKVYNKYTYHLLYSYIHYKTKIKKFIQSKKCVEI